MAGWGQQRYLTDTSLPLPSAAGGTRPRHGSMYRLPPAEPRYRGRCPQGSTAPEVADTRLGPDPCTRDGPRGARKQLALTHEGTRTSPAVGPGGHGVSMQVRRTGAAEGATNQVRSRCSAAAMSHLALVRLPVDSARSCFHRILGGIQREMVAGP